MTSPAFQGSPWVRLCNLETNWGDDLLKRLLPSLGWRGALPATQAVQENGKKVYILTCKTDAQAKALYSILAVGESPQFPYCVSWLEGDSPKPKFFSKCPPPSHIDCMKFLGDGSSCAFKTSINQGKGSYLNEECCPFRHPIKCAATVCEAWAEHQKCDAGAKCKKLHPAGVLIEFFKKKFPAPQGPSPSPQQQPNPTPPSPPSGPKPCPGPSTQHPFPPPPPPGPKSKPKPVNNQNPPYPPNWAGPNSQAGPSPGPKPGPKPKPGPQRPAPPRPPSPPLPKGKPVCLNPACPKSPQGCNHGPAGVRVDEATIKKLLQPFELLDRPPNWMEIEKLEKEMRGRLSDIKEEKRFDEEVKKEVGALYQGVKEIEDKKPNLDDPLKSCGTAARMLSETICRKLLEYFYLPPGQFDSLDTMIFNLEKIDVKEAQKKDLIPEFIGLLHVLRSYGNTVVHPKAKALPMPDQKYDRLLIVTAYGYRACENFLTLLRM